MERGVPKLETELEYAPITREGLEQALGGLGCSGECYMAVCTQDRHHAVFGEDLGEGEKLLRYHPDFILPTFCRAKHQVIHGTWDRSEPVTDAFAVGYLTASPLNLNANKRKRLKEIRKGL